MFLHINRVKNPLSGHGKDLCYAPILNKVILDNIVRISMIFFLKLSCNHKSRKKVEEKIHFLGFHLSKHQK